MAFLQGAWSNFFVYKPDQDYYGIDDFILTATDPSGLSSTQTITVNVLPINDVPVSKNTATSVREDEALVERLPAGIDTDGDSVVFFLSKGPRFGTASVTADGSLSYLPNKDFNGADNLSFQVTDGKGASNDYVVAITVTSVNDSPSLPW